MIFQSKKVKKQYLLVDFCKIKTVDFTCSISKTTYRCKMHNRFYFGDYISELFSEPYTELFSEIISSVFAVLLFYP